MHTHIWRHALTHANNCYVTQRNSIKSQTHVHVCTNACKADMHVCIIMRVRTKKGGITASLNVLDTPTVTMIFLPTVSTAVLQSSSGQ